MAELENESVDSIVTDPPYGLVFMGKKWDYDVPNTATSGNTHPTVKPIALMKHLVELVTPPGGLVVAPFMGSGTTGMAAVELERNFIGIEMEPEFFDIVFNRVNYARKQKTNA